MKITIITVCLNDRQHILHCINSVFNQSHRDTEHIIIDGASTDGTLEILLAERGKYSKLLSEQDLGIYDAMNKGISLATGDVVGFLNTDDFYASSEVLACVDRIFSEALSVDACYADLVYVDRLRVERIIRNWSSGPYVGGSFSLGWCPPHPTFFVRRHVFQKFGRFNTTYSLAADFEFMFRLLEVNKIQAVYHPELWVKMRRGGKSNKSLLNILKQNYEIVCVLRSYSIEYSLLLFIIKKSSMRIRQRFNKFRR